VVVNVLASRWLVLCTHVRTCKDVFSDSQGQWLILYRVLLDDVLSAVDSQVARQVFGMLTARFPCPAGIANGPHIQIKL
jgi:hypothetical protein